MAMVRLALNAAHKSPSAASKISEGSALNLLTDVFWAWKILIFAETNGVGLRKNVFGIIIHIVNVKTIGGTEL